MCGRPATEINEIIPRSWYKSAVLIEHNRVPLCRNCHEAFHHDGITAAKMREMRRKALDKLELFGEPLEKW